MTKSELTSPDAGNGAEAGETFFGVLWRNRPLPPIRPGAPLRALTDVIDRMVALERAGDDLSRPAAPLPEEERWRARCFRLYRHPEGWRFEIAMEQWHWVVLEWMEKSRGHGFGEVFNACEAHRGKYTRSCAMRFYTQEYFYAYARHYGHADAPPV